MIKDAKYLEQWENRLIASEPRDFSKDLELLDALIEEARMLGAFPPADPLEGIEVKIRIARTINGLKTD
jgi:hypothetical protein